MEALKLITNPLVFIALSIFLLPGFFILVVSVFSINSYMKRHTYIKRIRMINYAILIVLLTLSVIAAYPILEANAHKPDKIIWQIVVINGSLIIFSLIIELLKAWMMNIRRFHSRVLAQALNDEQRWDNAIGMIRNSFETGEIHYQLAHDDYMQAVYVLAHCQQHDILNLWVARRHLINVTDGYIGSPAIINFN